MDELGKQPIELVTAPVELNWLGVLGGVILFVPLKVLFLLGLISLRGLSFCLRGLSEILGLFLGKNVRFSQLRLAFAVGLLIVITAHAVA